MESRIGFHAPHELYPPSELLRFALRAEQAGFGALTCSDHSQPWSERQGHSGFSWSWLGAALQSTSLPAGVVCAPGPRYHPVVLAQAAATLLEMFPGRFWMVVGSGEALNESITGVPWPEKAERNARLKEAVEIMRALWRDETVTHSGLFTVREARLYTLPQDVPLVLGAALTEPTAEWLGGWTDGLLTAGSLHEGVRKMIDAFRRGGGEGKPIYLQTAISYGRSEEDALASAYERWRHAVLDPPQLGDLPTPRAFDQASLSADAEQLKERLRISADLKQHRAWLEQDLDLGISSVFILFVGSDMERFIDDFGEHVLPRLRRPKADSDATAAEIG